MRSASTSRCSRQSRSHAAAEPDGLEQLGAAAATRRATRPRRARAPGPSPPSSVATRPGARSRAGDARSPPRPGCACAAASTSRRGPATPSRTSPTSVCASSDDVARRPSPTTPAADAERAGQLGRRASGSCATRAPARRARAPPASAREHARPVLAERGERSRRAAELHGEPRRAGRRPGAPATSSSAGRSSPAAFSPNVIGQRLLQQRAPGHQRVAVAVGQRRPPRRRRRARSSSSGPSARCATSIAAVSRMSWLVAPRWTWSRGRALHARPSARCTSGTTGLPAVGRVAARSRRCRSRSAAARRRDRLGVLGDRSDPARASARASAASTSSIACSQARSLTSPRTRPRASTPSKSPPRRGVRRRRRRSHPPPAGGCRSGSRRRSRSASSVARRRPDQSRDEHRVAAFALGLVGEVDPRDSALQQAAREHRDVDVRRLRRAVRRRAPRRASP